MNAVKNSRPRKPAKMDRKIVLLLAIIVAIVVIVLLVKYFDGGADNTVTTAQLFGKDITIQSIPQIKRTESTQDNIFRSFNPSVVKLNNELIYAYRVSNALNCETPLDYIKDKFVVANNPSKSSFISLSNGKVVVDINSTIVGGKMCSKGYEDPRVLASPDGEHLLISASACSGPNCRSEMWLLDIPAESYHAAKEAPGLTSSIIPLREVKLSIDFDPDSPQKNWMPFYDKQDLMFVYAINPHTILKCDAVSGKCKKVVWTANDNLPKGLRGGSQVIEYKGEYIAATHRQVGNHSYVTQFYTFETKHPYRVTGVTPDFKFSEQDGKFSRIQFVAGLSIVKNDLTGEDTALLTYGEEDCYSKECRVPMKSIMEAIAPVDLQKTTVTLANNHE